jgi:hypothetical protein
MDVPDMREQWTVWLRWLDKWLGDSEMVTSDFSMFIRGTVPGCNTQSAVGIKYWPKIIAKLKERVETLYDTDINDDNGEVGEAFLMPEEIKAAWVWGECFLRVSRSVNFVTPFSAGFS